MTTPEPSASPSLNLKNISPKVWVYLLIGGLVIGLYLRSRRGGGPSTEITEGSADEVGTGGGFVSVVPSATGSTAPSIEDNNAWGSAAIQSLAGSGYDPAMADEAIRRYLDGLTLSPAQGTLISQAIKNVGPTPDVLPAGPALPTNPVAANPAANTPPSKPSTTSTPKAPTGLKATQVQDKRITLQWNAVSGVKGYAVYRNGTFFKDSFDTTVIDYHLKPATKYVYTVKAVGPTGIKSAASSPLSVTTKKTS